MSSAADKLLANGVRVLEQAHGEPVEILSGDDAGATFTAIIETETDSVLSAALGDDPRPRRVMRFSAAPRMAHSVRVRTSDGRQWTAVRMPGQAHLTNDYELTEITANDS